MQGEAAELLRMTDCFGAGETSVEKSDAAFLLLVERAKAGDGAAFEQIMILHQRKVVSTAWRLLGNEDDARDAGQEVFLRVYRHLSKFKTDEDFSGWLYRITINVCRDIGRKRGRAGRFSSFEAEQQLGNLETLASQDDLERAAIRREQQRIVAEALDTLSKKEKAAIVLRDLEGLPTEEVARILGSSQTTVRSQISSARAKIKLFRDRLLKPKHRG
jgi:RNA polymerase sigma-70 factor (ECF subfamily)